MKQGFGLEQSLKQGMTITPQMIQALKIVQLSTPELLEHIQHEVADNPFLEEINSKNYGLNTTGETARDEKAHNHEYEEDYKEPREHLPSSKPLRNDQESTSNVIESTAVYTKNLHELLTDQLQSVYDKDSKEFLIGMMIIDNIDEHGFFKSQSCSEILKDFVKNESNLSTLCLKVLDQIRNFEPGGIASEDVRTCLLKQLEMYEGEEYDLAEIILEKHYDFFIKQKKNELAKLLNKNAEEIDLAIHTISLLDPYPAQKYNTDVTAFIHPDVIVRPDAEGQFEVKINNEMIPDLSFNNEYSKFSQTEKNQKTYNYLKEKENHARYLLNSIKFRFSNLKKVMAKLVDVQRDFFMKGPDYIKPYTLVQFADEIEINQGTLSRIINSKYIDTEWGLFSLKKFFSASVKTNKGEIAANSLKNILKEMIIHYNGKKKLSDQMLVELLKKQKGITIARRTVAKYRKELNILSSFHR